MSKTELRSDTELYDVARLFYGDDCPHIFVERDGDVFSVEQNEQVEYYTFADDITSLIPAEHRVKRLAKIALYDALCKKTGRAMPWGTLTGVRPTKLFYELMRFGLSRENAQEAMEKIYRVSPSRSAILNEIVEAQNGKLHFPGTCNLYVHVPYCTTRCSYCSFVSLPVDKRPRETEAYMDALCREIEASLKFLRDNDIKLLSVYIGGGTPTAPGDADFSKMLDAIGHVGCEYTCEAGRPDTVTKEKCAIMKEHGVTRVCVNPQTLNDDTLATIGRSHTKDEFFSAYETVEKFGFDINCDLIAGLPGESLHDFINSFDGVKALAPQNLTVHSLSKKNGSALRYQEGENDETAAMLEFALNNAGGYRPYYLYRQKRQSGNLENVGFSIPGKECVNNITTMEETVPVMACGAGAISKIFVGKDIVRHANMRDVGLYLSRFDERLEAKLAAFASAL